MNVLYLDVLLAVNYGMDYLSLYFSGKLLHLPLRRWRLLLAACPGAAFAAFAILVLENTGWYYPCFFLCGAGMVLLAFGRCGGVRGFLACLASHTAASVILGGAVGALYQLMEGWVRPGQSAAIGKAEYLMLLALLSGGLIRLLSGILDRFGKSRKAKIRVRAFGRSTTATVLCDSGHYLREPISGRVVILLCPRVLRFLPCAVREELAGECPVSDERLRRKFRVIPASGIGGKTVLRGFVPDEVLLESGRPLSAVIAMGEEEDYGGTDGVMPPVPGGEE